ncbi:hypothetical protein PUN28_008693 [Cardiocondyla obscurior]|uniref:Secreted protein n=1 Tax=Cardiocondyla obscurior TaxID=286306 RepID=A0AAW2G2A2_9HYME
MLIILPSISSAQYSLLFHFERDVTARTVIAYLVCSSPISFILLQHSFPEHGHHLWKLLVRERGLSQFLHHCTLKSNAFRIINRPAFRSTRRDAISRNGNRTCGTPCVVVGCLPNFGLCFRVIHHDVRPTNKKS